MKVQYQLDAPPVVKFFCLLGLACSVGSLTIHMVNSYFNYTILYWSFWLIFYSGISYLLISLAMVLTSFITKKRLIKILLPKLLTGHRKVLEIGIGSRLGAITLAENNPAMRIDAIDTFNINDHKNNSLTLCQHNLKASHVDKNVTAHTADMRDMPFNSNHFDAAFGILSIHNLKRKIERKTALLEIIRVIKPGGKLIIIDFKYHKEYRKHLRQLGATGISISRPYISVFPFLRVTTATAP